MHQLTAVCFSLLKWMYTVISFFLIFFNFGICSSFKIDREKENCPPVLLRWRTGHQKVNWCKIDNKVETFPPPFYQAADRASLFLQLEYIDIALVFLSYRNRIKMNVVKRREQLLSDGLWMSKLSMKLINRFCKVLL